ncbi:MAG: hypothetical protein IRY85_01970 [Micromonosporaceae bacterium]|nr:hypothetical protein [Micromonosporaceae bacterium]
MVKRDQGKGGYVQIPRFWEVAEGSGTGPRGEPRFRRVWGWSMSSVAEARAVAAARLRDALTMFRSGDRPGRYYPRTPLREPILDEVILDDAQAIVVTRNRYGAEILNTDRLLIADIDLIEPVQPEGLLRRLLGRRPAGPTVDPARMDERVTMLATWAAAHPDLGVRVYRTASGLRVFVTGLAEPTSPAGDHILAELGADPIYRELCRTHGMFRARLTPKPWRLPRLKSPTGRWPYETARAERRFQQWLTAYATASAGYAVCQLVATYGPGPSPVEQRVIQLHDDRTRPQAPLPLA